MTLVLTKRGVERRHHPVEVVATLKGYAPVKVPPGVRVVKPQDGPQMAFLTCGADLCIYGGGAGGGKSFGLLMEAVRNINTPGYGAVIFRRTCPEITNEGGLWDESMELYPGIGGTPFQSRLEWRFAPHGCSVTFAHMQHEKDKLEWQGSQVPFVGWDELTHFSEGQFFYLLSRMRSGCGVRPYVRATCNPDPDSWVASFISWWIDQRTGFPIPERAGVIRWMVRQGDEIVWKDSKEEAAKICVKGQEPISATFIPASVDDNPLMLERNPGYKASLHALPKVEMERLLKGNWKIRRNAGDYFQRAWFGEPLEQKDVPTLERLVRYWDRASTKPSPSNPDPDWTVGLLLGRTQSGLSVVVDVERFRGSPGEVEQRIREVGARDGGIPQILEQDPGQAGAADVFHLSRSLSGIPCLANRVSTSKAKRALPVSAACERKLVKVVRGEWNEAFFNELEAFAGDEVELPAGTVLPHDDQVDALSGAFNQASRGNPRLRFA